MFSCCTFHSIFIVCNSYFGINNNVSLQIVLFYNGEHRQQCTGTVHFDNYLLFFLHSGRFVWVWFVWDVLAGRYWVHRIAYSENMWTHIALQRTEISTMPGNKSSKHSLRVSWKCIYNEKKIATSSHCI